jgi:predicted ATPase
MVSPPATERDAPPVPPVIQVPGFVGREEEMAALARVVGDGPAVVLVEGEAGVGKTRLVREFLAARSRPGRVALVADCPPFRQPCTLGPVVDAVRQAVGGGALAGLGLSALAGALRPLFPEWGTGLPPAPEPLADATAARHRVFRALAELVDRLRVTELVVEDAHWADEATLEFLLYLIANPPRPVSLLVTVRPDEVAAGSLLARLGSRRVPGLASLRLALEPLDLAGTGALVSSMLAGEQVSAGFAEFLHERT